MVFQYSYTSTHTLRLPIHSSSWMVLNRALQPQGYTGDPRVHPPEFVFALLVFIFLKFIRANQDNFRKLTSVYNLYYSGHKICRSSSLHRTPALYWLYTFLGRVLNMILLWSLSLKNIRNSVRLNSFYFFGTDTNVIIFAVYASLNIGFRDLCVICHS